MHQKKVTGTVWCSAASLIHCSFLNSGKTITSEKSAYQTDKMHWKHFNVCSQHWSTERVQFFSITMPDCMSHNQCFKSWMNWTTKFCLICHNHLTFHQPHTTSSNILTTICRQNTSTIRRRQKIFPKSSLNPEAWFSRYRNKKLIFFLQKRVDCNGSYFD